MISEGSIKGSFISALDKLSRNNPGISDLPGHWLNHKNISLNVVDCNP